MLALAALVLVAQNGAALAHADAAHWRAPARPALTAAARHPATRIKALEQAVRRLDAADQPASYANSGPSGL
jgi:hypothetical protein